MGINLNPGILVTWLWCMLFLIETLCGRPPIIESTEQVWNGDSTPGSTVLYFCKVGFYNKGGHNVSICKENAQWSPPTLSCKEILCGDPPMLPHTGQVWNSSSTPGSTVSYYCEIGFYHNEGKNTSLCTNNGYWTKPNITCKGNNLQQNAVVGIVLHCCCSESNNNNAISILVEVDCGVPPPIPHSFLQWDNISTVGSQVVYHCNYGYRNVGEGNVSVCTASGEWKGASLLCQGDNDIRKQNRVLGYLPQIEVLMQSSQILAIHHNLHAVTEQYDSYCHYSTSIQLPVTYNDLLSLCCRNQLSRACF